MRDSDPVPLWRDFLVFTGVLARRLSQYVVQIGFTLQRAVMVIFYLILSFKSSIIRLLMRRAGFFAPLPRLGYLTLSGGAVFGLLFIPGLASLTTSYQAQQILAQSLPNQEGVVLSGTSDTLLSQNSPTVIGPSDPSRQEIIEYEVQSGDTLSSIGERYLVSVEALSYVNHLAGSLLHPGDKITIPPVDGLIYQVREGESIATIATRHNVSPQALVDANLLEAPFIIHAGDELVVPGGEIPVPEPAANNVYLADRSGGGLSLQTMPGAAASGSLMMPALGSITQYFSWYHPAIDIANKGCGQAVVAADSGTIYFAGWWAGGGGNTVMIDHGNGLVTKYAHLGGFERTSGGVAKGEVIGYVGATGRAYGCHLHYVVEQGGRAVNPLSL